MARKLLTEWPLCKEILDGKHDEDLRQIEAAISHRRKAMDRATGARAGDRFYVTQTASKVYGQTGTIVKVNPKRYHVVFDGDDIFREFACPKEMGTVENQTPQDRVANLAKLSRDSRGNFVYTNQTVSV